MFETTRWGLILAARTSQADRREALEQLCRAYRGPVLAYVRRHAAGNDEAEDLTQAFFLRFVEGGFEQSADPSRGRFRMLLLTMVKRFLANARDHAQAAKRGGSAKPASLDGDGEIVAVDPSESPERTFERAWALTVLDRALAKMRKESIESGKQALFARLKEFLIEAPDPAQYDRIAGDLGVRRHTVAMAVHRLRERLRTLVRREMAETVGDADSMDAEMTVLRSALQGG
jgi:RNA polymerase sigma-70 factor (ECF subfamily)